MLIPESYASLTNKKVISLGRLNQQKTVRSSYLHMENNSAKIF